MTKDSHRKRSGELRRLIRHLRDNYRYNYSDAFTSGGFGFYYDSQYKLWRLVNNYQGNVIATVKIKDIRNRSGSVTVRYRPNSFYRAVLTNSDLWKFQTRGEVDRTMVIPSTKLGKHRTKAVNAIRELVENSTRTVPSRPQVHMMDVVEIDATSTWSFSVDEAVRSTVDIDHSVMRDYQRAFYASLREGRNNV